MFNSGYEIALGFPNKLRVGTILDGDIILTRAIPVKGVSHVSITCPVNGVSLVGRRNLSLLSQPGGTTITDTTDPIRQWWSCICSQQWRNDIHYGFI